MERLLKKSESKSVKIGQKQRGSKKTFPSITYMDRKDLITLSLPADVPFPLTYSERYVIYISYMLFY